MMDGPSTSGLSNKELDLEKAQKAFEGESKTQELATTITVRRQKRGLRHVAEDFVFVVSFSESDAGSQPVLNVLLGVHESIMLLIKKTEDLFFRQAEKALFFFSLCG